MGPRSCDRGEILLSYFLRNKYDKLQWGRGHVTAESQPLRLATPWGTSLQWGRGHVTAESLYLFGVTGNVSTLQWGRGHVTAERCSIYFE